ncbi:MAG: SUF system NifU family Fe-S cluster assembly protein [Deltaproteobacteria bacterium]|nr:SUF system NifU family Fe-S cluster assembly protein [Deltaproteobacteria bacterium]
MDDLRELYQETILDHNKKPRNFRVLEDATHEADGHNPLCGDALTLYARVSDDDRLEDVSFEGQGCAISKASASLMTGHVKGKTLEEVQADFDRFHELVTSSPTDVPQTEGLGKLAVFTGVREYPMRVKCATLAWHALRAALEGKLSAKTE